MRAGGAITDNRPGAITEDWTGAIIRDRQKRFNLKRIRTQSEDEAGSVGACACEFGKALPPKVLAAFEQMNALKRNSEGLRK